MHRDHFPRCEVSFPDFLFKFRGVTKGSHLIDIVLVLYRNRLRAYVHDITLKFVSLCSAFGKNYGGRGRQVCSNEQPEKVSRQYSTNARTGLPMAGRPFNCRFAIMLEHHRPSADLFLVNTDFKRLQKLYVLGSNIQSRFAYRLLGFIRFLGCSFLALVEAYGSLQDEKDVISCAPNSGYGVADPVRAGKSIVYG